MGKFGSKGQGARAERKRAELLEAYMHGFKKGIRDGWWRGAIIGGVVVGVIMGTVMVMT